jgi:methylmalonyl-CoA mutase N-terminal domain/subunit
VILFCFYAAAAEKQGVPLAQIQGTVQNDILKEYMAQHAWCFPIEPALRLIVDMFEWSARTRRSGTPSRSAATTSARPAPRPRRSWRSRSPTGSPTSSAGIARGLDVDDFAPRLSFFWDIHNDFFEEIAKLRAARRIWARRLRDKYGAKDPRSMVMRFHSQTAGVTLTAQQPINNVVRVAYQAMAAVLGGTQSLHTNSMDETLALPTEASVQVALRTQQILAYETGVPNVADPLGGSYYVEALTDQLERDAERLFEEIDAQGGVVEGLEAGWFQRRIAESAARQQWEFEQRRKVIVGVNEFVTDEDGLGIPLLRIGEEAEREQRAAMAGMRASRDDAAVRARLDALRTAARGSENLIPFILDCARAYCTLYEIRAALEDVFGAYREPVFF